MIAKFFAVFLAQLSEEIFDDVMKAMALELTVNRKKGDIASATETFNGLIHEVAVKEITQDEKNKQLADAGLDYFSRVDGMRKRDRSD